MELNDRQSEASATAGASDATTSLHKERDAIGAAVSLTFPITTGITDPTPHLASLRDNHSSYAAVAKTCFQLNQYALNGSSSAMEDVNSVHSSALFHDASFANSMGGENGVFVALMECIQTHDDRRAKITACKTLAIVARATYARIRHSPHLFALRDSTNTRLEDEVGTDIPRALVTAALEELDDGVAASAIHALGIMTLSTSATPGTLVDDELQREIIAMAYGRPAPHSPTLGALQDEDANIPQMILQSRIFENVISPRLMQLVCRVTAFESHQHIRTILPILTASLVHSTKISPPLLYGLDRATYAKRWLELDFVNLVTDVVKLILLPAMQSSLDGQLAYAASMSSIRLINACPHAPWLSELVHWVLVVLKEEANVQESLESKLTTLASLLVCCRTVPFPERLSTLEFVFEFVSTLPSTTIAPFGINSPGLLLDYRGLSHYRRPARVAFLAEIALSFFLDGPTKSESARVVSLEKFMKSAVVTSAVRDIANGEEIVQVGEEFVLAFCAVAMNAGRQLRSQDAGKSPTSVVSVERFHEWVRMSLAVLKACLPCISWGGTSTVFIEEDLEVSVAAQVSYVSLLEEVLHSGGLLKSMSVSFTMTPSACPPNMLWDQMVESATFLGKHHAVASMEQNHLDAIARLMEEIIKRELKGSGIVSHHMRLYLMGLAADQYIQNRFLSYGSQKANIKEKSAKELLTALSPRRVFGKVVESHKSQIDQYTKKKKESYKKYAQETVTVCVACIENLALFTCDWKKRFGKSSETSSILNHAIASLQGKTDNEADAPILPVCKAAIERIQDASSSSDKSTPDTMSLSQLIPSLPMKKRPAVTASRSQQGKDQYHVGYLMQLSRQIILSRIDGYLLSSPPVHSFQGAARKQNWLRLALPPLPATREQKILIKHMPRFVWRSCTNSISGGSDAATLTLAYSMRRNLRYDGEDEFRLMITMRVTNIAAVEVPNGIRLELGILHESAALSSDAEDSTSQEVLKSLSDDKTIDGFGDPTLTSAVALYKPELKSGDYLTWQVMLDVLPMTGSITINPSIVYRSLDEDGVHASWVGPDNLGEDSSTLGKAVTRQSTADVKSRRSERKENVLIPGEAVRLSPMIGLQPCPIVFFRDGSGDVDTFRFLWSRVPFQTTPLKIEVRSDDEPTGPINPPLHEEIRLAAVSTIRFGGESIPGGQVTKLWAFMSIGGKRALFVLAESKQDKTVHVRGDCKALLACLVGTQSGRRILVGSLQPGFILLEK
jgi:hypothetical protein